MKKLSFFTAMMLLLTFARCKEDNDAMPSGLKSCYDSASAIDTQINKNGVVRQLAGIWVIDITVNGDIRRGQPCNLPNELKVENKQIILDANFYPTPPNVRMVGWPIEIIRVYEKISSSR